MLSPRCRLKQREAFTQVYQLGQRRSRSLCTLRWLPIPTSEGSESMDKDPSSPEKAVRPTQVALVVSKKVSRKAVDRNRVRRRFWAAFHALWPRIHPGYWILVTVHDRALTATWPQLTTELEQLLQKAKLLSLSSPESAHLSERDIKIGKVR